MDGERRRVEIDAERGDAGEEKCEFCDEVCEGGGFGEVLTTARTAQVKAGHRDEGLGFGLVKVAGVVVEGIADAVTVPGDVQHHRANVGAKLLEGGSMADGADCVQLVEVLQAKSAFLEAECEAFMHDFFAGGKQGKAFVQAQRQDEVEDGSAVELVGCDHWAVPGVGG